MNIVAAVDPSPPARRVVERALERARQDEATLHVVHVFQPPSTVYPVQGMYLIEDEEIEKAQHELVWSEIGDLLESAEVDIIRSELRGYPSSAIVGYAEDVDADLIVVGTRGRGGFASLVLGSTSQGVIHDADCDVLVVHTPVDDD